MFFLKYNYKSAIAITIGLMVLCGCAVFADKHISITYLHNNESSKWPDKKLEKLFQDYWFNRFAGAVEEGYRIETPYIREMISLGKYNNYVKHAAANKLMNMEIREITKETEFLVSVSCAMQTQAAGGKPITTPIIDRWVLVGKNWFHVIKDPILLSF